MSDKPKAPSLNTNAARRTDFAANPPSRNEWLVYDYYANGTIQGVVRVVKVKSKYFVVSGDRRVGMDGKIKGYETAIVRRDHDAVKAHRRNVGVHRLQYYSYEGLPYPLIREMNRLIDEYEIKSHTLKQQRAVSKLMGEKDGPEAGPKQPGMGLKGRSGGKTRQNSSKHVESPGNAPKATWGTRPKLRFMDD